MNRSVLFCFLAVLTVLSVIKCSSVKSETDINGDIRILSYNVRNCMGLDSKTDYKRIASVIIRVSPDVVALQELDSVTLRSNGIYVLDELASLTGMVKTFGASIDFQGGKYGIGILTKEKPLRWEVIHLPGREERRSLLIVELKNYVICCTHFSLNSEDRLASIGIIKNKLWNFTKPVFLAGDFNSIPESPLIEGIVDDWNMLSALEPTFPSNNPQRCIDYIFAARFTPHTFEVKQTIVELEPLASDHLPLWVDVTVK